MDKFVIDVGGVLASKQHDGEPMPGSLEVVELLSKRFELHVLSMCGKQRAENTKVWLRDQGFERFIHPTRQVYVPFKQYGKDVKKAPYLHALNAHYFIDDRLKHILPALAVPSLRTSFLLDSEGKYQEFSSLGVERVTSWHDVMEYMQL